MGVTAGIFLASILLKEMRYLVYKRYLWKIYVCDVALSVSTPGKLNRLDLVARLVEHWTGKPNVAGSIPTAFKQTLQLAQCGHAQRQHHRHIIFQTESGIFLTDATLNTEFLTLTMDDSSYRLNFDLGKKNEIHHHS